MVLRRAFMRVLCGFTVYRFVFFYALYTLTIFTFVNTWNDFLGPLIYLTSEHKKTLQIGLKMFISQYSAEYGLIMAASVLSLIPVLVVFLSLQKYFVEGIASTGVKG
jgi:multiple sugar transport system permease protein